MYWIFLIFFIVAVLVPDIVGNSFYFLTEERVEEILIFLLGSTSFFIIIRNERQIQIQKLEKEKSEKRINQTVKDLVESYSYIGEVNRKMDILMNIALGISDRSVLSKNKEIEIYESIVSAASFLMKADCATLRFVDVRSGKTKKEIKTEEKTKCLSNRSLVKWKGDTSVKKVQDFLIVSSPQKVNEVKSFIIISGYDKDEENSPKNLEILKVFASQAIFLYSYATRYRSGMNGRNGK